MAIVRYGETNGTTYGQSVVDVLELALHDHGAWTKMAVVYSGDGQPCSVWKNSGTRNHLGRDWYFLIGRVVTTSQGVETVKQVRFAVAEGWDPYEQRMIRPAPGSGVETTRPAKDGSYGGGVGFDIWTEVPPRREGDDPTYILNSVDFLWHAQSFSTTDRPFYVVITEDTVAFFSRGQMMDSSGGWVHAGVAEPFRLDDLGIVAIMSNATDGAMTRHPYINAAGKDNWRLTKLSTSTNWTPLVGKVGGMGDRLHDSRPVGARILARHKGSSGTQGALRGLFRNMLALDVATQPSPIQVGDYIFITDDQYIWPGGTSGKPWFNTTVA